MPRRYPPEFRRKVLDLLKSGRTVAEVAAGLDVTEQTIYNWRNQELIDTGQKPGLSSIESAELAAARRRIAELETELAIAKRSTELLKSVVLPKGGLMCPGFHGVDIAGFRQLADSCDDAIRTLSGCAFRGSNVYVDGCERSPDTRR